LAARSSLLQRLFSLQGKAVLITGAGGGIGRVLARALAEAGARVAIHDVNADLLAESSRAIAGAGGEAVSFLADLATVECCRQLVREVHDSLGRLDVLVNCAGVNRRAPIAAVTEEDYETIKDHGHRMGKGQHPGQLHRSWVHADAADGGISVG